MVRRGAGAVARLLVVTLALAVSACASESERPQASATSETGVGGDTTTTEPVLYTELVEIRGTGRPTATARGEAEALLRSVTDAVRRHGWTDEDSALASGYEPMEGDRFHLVNPDAVADSKMFDPDAPEFLVVDEGRIVAVMFLADHRGSDLAPPPGDPIVRWHYHHWSVPVCLEGGLIATGLESDGCGPGQEAALDSPLMVHVWLNRPDDPFSAEMQPA